MDLSQDNKWFGYVVLDSSSFDEVKFAKCKDICEVNAMSMNLGTRFNISGYPVETSFKLTGKYCFRICSLHMSNDLDVYFFAKFTNNELHVKAIEKFNAKSLSELMIAMELEGFLSDEPCVM